MANHMDKKPSELNSDDIQELKNDFMENITPETIQLFDNVLASFEVLSMLLEEMEKDEAIKEQLAAMDTIEEALGSEPLNTLFERVSNRIKAEHPEIQDENTDPAELDVMLPQIIAREFKKVIYPIGKVNSDFWTLFEKAERNGQIAISVGKKGVPAEILYGINFDALEGLSITKKLTAFDKRVYIATGALYNAGNDIITISQIYTAMGNTGRPSSTAAKKINDAITKMNLTHIFISNTDKLKYPLKEGSKYYPESKSFPKRQPFTYDASLLPMERISGVIVNNLYVESAIHLFREPPLITFATARKQITTIPRKLLESPISKTEANLTIDDYLIDHIGQIKRAKGKLSNKMLFDTIYEACGITTIKQKQRATTKIETYLEYYKKCGFIKNYKLVTDGIEISY